MLWSKQFYDYDVDTLAGRPRDGASHGNGVGRAHDATPTGSTWSATTSSRCRTSGSTRGTRPGTSRFTPSRSALVDPDFAKQQLLLLLQERYLHPNGQVPGLRVELRRRQPARARLGRLLPLPAGEAPHRHRATSTFLKSIYNKLLLNFTWWVNRKDPAGRNVFEGGFLGLDSIGVFDRSATLPARRPPGAGGRHRVDGVLRADRCCRSPSSWRSTIRRTPTWR